MAFKCEGVRLPRPPLFDTALHLQNFQNLARSRETWGGGPRKRCSEKTPRHSAPMQGSVTGFTYRLKVTGPVRATVRQRYDVMCLGRKRYPALSFAPNA